MKRYSTPSIVIKILIVLVLTTEALADRTGRPEKRSCVAELLSRIDADIVKQFRKAWAYSNSGVATVEGLVLIFRLPDGGYQARLHNRTNQYKRVSFSWTPDIAAIVHTHPKSSDPKPSIADEKTADACGVPIFTITMEGMYVYDPTTKQTSKVMNGLDWLKPSKWNAEVYARVSEEKL